MNVLVGLCSYNTQPFIMAPDNEDAPAGLSVPDALVEEFRRVSSMEEYTHSL
jgi:hypothetical protein